MSDNARDGFLRVRVAACASLCFMAFALILLTQGHSLWGLGVSFAGAVAAFAAWEQAGQLLTQERLATKRPKGLARSAWRQR